MYATNYSDAGASYPIRHQWANNPTNYHGAKPKYGMYYEPYKFYAFHIYDVNLW
jgi:hypothetical protein